MTIKFNNESYTVESFNKNTTFDGQTVSSSAYCSVKTDDIDSLHDLGATTVSTIQIINEDDEVIYNSTQLNGKLTSMEEYLNGNQMNINLHFNFN